MKPPRKVSISGLNKELKREFNSMVDYVESLRVVESESVKVQRTTKGTMLKARGGGDTTSVQGNWYYG